MRDFSLTFAEVFPEDALNQEKQQMAAVENGLGAKLRTPRLMLRMAMKDHT